MCRRQGRRGTEDAMPLDGCASVMTIIWCRSALYRSSGNLIVDIRNVVHRGLRRFIENDDTSGLDSAAVPKVRRIVSFLQDMGRKNCGQYRIGRCISWPVTAEAHGALQSPGIGGSGFVFPRRRSKSSIWIMRITADRRRCAHAGIRMKNPAHPGGFVKTEIIEAMGLSVTGAAQALGVTRAALSAMLNERAHLSPGMALRLEGFRCVDGYAHAYAEQL